jgi:hypothetical protein
MRPATRSQGSKLEATTDQTRSQTEFLNRPTAPQTAGPAILFLSKDILSVEGYLVKRRAGHQSYRQLPVSQGKRLAEILIPFDPAHQPSGDATRGESDAAKHPCYIIRFNSRLSVQCSLCRIIACPRSTFKSEFHSSPLPQIFTIRTENQF